MHQYTGQVEEPPPIYDRLTLHACSGRRRCDMVKIRGIEFQANTDNDMGLEFYNLSHRYGFQCPNWPYFKDVAIERQHYMAKSGVLSQTITTTICH